MSEQVKLAIIGCGGIAGAHLSGYEKLLRAGYERFRIAAMVDNGGGRARELADRWAGISGARPVIYGSVEEMLAATRPDGADICTPHAFHHTAALPCLKLGVPVMVEKPCGITVRASRKMLAAAEKSGAFIATAEQVRRCTGARALEWAINRKKMIGQPRFFVMEVFGHQQFDWKSYKFSWRGLRLLTGGGMLIDAGAHFADMMLHVFGPVAEVSADMRTYWTPVLNGPAGLGKRKLDVEDTWLATLRFESGLIGHWGWSREARGHTVQASTYYGAKGSFQDKQKWMHPFQFGADLKLDDGTETPYEEIEAAYLASLSPRQAEKIFPYGLGDGISNECWDFVDAIDKGRAPEVDGLAGLQAKALCYAFYESNFAGKPIRPADVESGKVRAYQRDVDEYWGI
jgi:predicted dehydrogenase